MLQVTDIKQLCQSIAQCVQLLVKYFECGSFTSHLVKIDAAKQWRFSWKSKSAQDQCSVDIMVGSICIGSGNCEEETSLACGHLTDTFMHSD